MNRPFRFLVPMLACMGIVFASILFPHQVEAYDNVVIVIDPGHGGDTEESDFGAIYADNLFEKDIDLITATALYEELSQYGNLTVYMTRTEDKHMTLKERAEYAKSVNADYLISVHYNASAHHRFFGAEIFTSAYDQCYAKGYSLAERIMNWWVEDGSFSKGIKTRLGNKGDYYGVIREARERGIPAIILEHGYLDHADDAAKFSDAEAWKRTGVLDATAIADFFGVKKGVVEANVTPQIVDAPASRVEPDATAPEDVSFTIDGYDPKTRLLSYTVYAKEPDGILVYYDLDTELNAQDEEKCFMNLKPWKRGENSMSGTYIVPENYSGGFVARVYDNYEMFTDTESQTIPVEYQIADAETAAAYLEAADNDADATGDLETEEGAETEDKKESSVWSLNLLENETDNPYEGNHDELKKESKSNYIGMIVAIVVVVLMLIASIIMTVLTFHRKDR